MSIASPHMLRNCFAGAAVFLGVWVGAAAPASAEPDAVDVNENVFGGLSCSCQQVTPPAGPGVSEEISRGLRSSHPAWAGMSAPVASR